MLIYGVASIFFEYAVDHQKEVFRASQGKCMIWGKPAEFLVSFIRLQGDSKFSLTIKILCRMYLTLDQMER